MSNIQTKSLKIKVLEKEAAGQRAIVPRFDRVGTIYAKQGTNDVERGEARGFRRFIGPAEINNNPFIVRSFQVPMTKAELFNPQYLRVDRPLLASLSQAKVCIGRGSLVKLLQVADRKYEYPTYKTDFVLNITKHSYEGNNYLVVEDKEKCGTKPEYGHTIANRFTELVDERYESWYHYDYHLVGLGNNSEGPHDFSILLRNEVDAVTEGGYRVEIKSHNNERTDIDWKHDALVVLTGQTEGLSLVTRNYDQIVKYRMYTRDNLKLAMPPNEYLRLLGIVKMLFMKLIAEMHNSTKAELVFNLRSKACLLLRKELAYKHIPL